MEVRRGDGELAELADGVAGEGVHRQRLVGPPPGRRLRAALIELLLAHSPHHGRGGRPEQVVERGRCGGSYA